MRFLTVGTLPTLGFWVFYILFSLGWFYYFWTEKILPEEGVSRLFILVTTVGVFCGFAWTFFVSGLLIDLLAMVGVLSKLSATYLALTIIAVGNALPDALITIALAKKG